MASIEKFVTNKGNPGLIVDGFKFRKDKIFKNYKLWRCVDKTCSSRCKTDLGDLIILDGRFEHDHAAPDRRNIERQRVRQTCKRKAEDEPSSTQKQRMLYCNLSVSLGYLYSGKFST